MWPSHDTGRYTVYKAGGIGNIQNGGYESDNRSRNRVTSDDAVDRISKLPDSIISVILSFLPTKTAVTTSVLSKGWRLLWTTAFDLDFFHMDRDGTMEQNRNWSIEFAQYVNRVLFLQRAGYINRLSVEWYSEFIIPSFVSDWVRTAMVRNVQKLNVYVDRCDPPIQMPLENIFTSERLQSLELMFCEIFISSGMPICLPRLECLALRSVRFQDAEVFQQLISGCPMLKKLDLDLEVLGKPFKCMVCLPHLKRLDFHFEGRLSDPIADGGAPRRLELELETPSLELIQLNGPIYWISIRASLRCLSKVYIHSEHQWGYSNVDTNYCNSIVLAIRALNSADTIVLPSHIIWALSCATVRLCTKFDRLKYLHLGAPRYYGSSVRDFIQCSDSLEDLTLHMESLVEPGELPNLPSWRNPEDVPICLSNTLRKVSISDYDGSEEEFAMIFYMLQNGSVMERMDISATNEEVGLLQDICALSRKSPNCKVGYEFK